MELMHGGGGAAYEEDDAGNDLERRRKIITAVVPLAFGFDNLLELFSLPPSSYLPYLANLELLWPDLAAWSLLVPAKRCNRGN